MISVSITPQDNNVLISFHPNSGALPRGLITSIGFLKKDGSISELPMQILATPAQLNLPASMTLPARLSTPVAMAINIQASDLQHMRDQESDILTIPVANEAASYALLAINLSDSVNQLLLGENMREEVLLSPPPSLDAEQIDAIDQAQSALSSDQLSQPLSSSPGVRRRSLSPDQTQVSSSPDFKRARSESDPLNPL